MNSGELAWAISTIGAATCAWLANSFVDICLLVFTSLTEEQLITIFPGEAIVVGWFDQASCDIGTDSFISPLPHA